MEKNMNTFCKKIEIFLFIIHISYNKKAYIKNEY